MPQRFYSVFLLLLLITGIGGYYPIFKLEQWHLRQDAKARIRQNLSEKDLLKIAVTPKDQNEFAWEREGEEFEYAGNMYDVVRTETLGQTRIYYCIDDEAEDKLLEKMEKMNQDEFERNEGPARDRTGLVLKLLLTFVHFADEPISFDHESNTTVWSAFFPAHASRGFLGEILHPPQA